MSIETTAELVARPRSGGWIESPAFDLAFFTLSPLVGLALVLVSLDDGNTLLTLAAATLIGGPHYLATYSFYFFDDTAAYHRKRWVAYFVVPILIVLAVGAIAWFKIPIIVLVVVYFWNAYHVARQSCGIQSIYRHRAGAFDPRLKTVTNAAIIATSLAMATAHLDWYPALYHFLSRPSPYLPDVISYGAMIDADLQNDPSDIGRLLAKLDEGYDVVSGWRKKDRKSTRLNSSH